MTSETDEFFREKKNLNHSKEIHTTPSTGDGQQQTLTSFSTKLATHATTSETQSLIELHYK